MRRTLSRAPRSTSRRESCLTGASPGPLPHHLSPSQQVLYTSP